ncbi:unnamed protein product, partial [Arabidopsis halleri]
TKSAAITATARTVRARIPDAFTRRRSHIIATENLSSPFDFNRFLDLMAKHLEFESIFLDLSLLQAVSFV